MKSHSIEEEKVVGRREKLLQILSGSFDKAISLKFLSQNNRANKDIITQIKATWDNKNSMI